MSALEPLAQGLWVVEWVDTFLRADTRTPFQAVIRQNAARSRTRRVRVVLELDTAEAAGLRKSAENAKCRGVS